MTFVSCRRFHALHARAASVPALGLTTVFMALSIAAASCATASPPAATPGITTNTVASGKTAPATLPSSNTLFPNATVERVVDGDTIIVHINGKRERVRLIGIDTPESVDQNRPVQCFGHEASAHTESLLPPGTEVSLVRDVEARDKYDRLLAYVIRTDDQLFVNLDLVENGFAGPLTYPPNDHYADLFESTASAAAAAGTGLWGTCGGPDVPLG